MLEDILAAARLQPGQTVLEVGPGPGNLTDLLARAVGPVGRVVAIEADRLLAHNLQGRWKNVDLVVGDAVKTDLTKPAGSPVRFDAIVANLPYLISGPITFAFLELLDKPETHWSHAVLMYQAEFARRLMASPGSKEYGRLTVHAARQVSVTKIRDVAPGCFDPPPQVDSMVVKLTPHPAPPFVVEDERMWRRVVDGAFQQRRKKMRNTVPGVADRPKDAVLATLDDLGLAELRPEDVAPERFAQLANALVAL